MNKPKEIIEIEKNYGLKLTVVIEEDPQSDVEFLQHENSFTVDANNKVVKLNLKRFALKDLKGLFKLQTTVTHLDLSGASIEDITILSEFKNLEFLNLNTNLISNVRPISRLKKLRSLYLDHNKIDELPNFETPNIAAMSLGANNIRNASGLRNLKNLYFLDLSSNRIRDLSFLESLDGITFLNMAANDILDITPLKRYKRMVFLNLFENGIVAIDALRNLKVTSLLLGKNSITDLSPIYPQLRDGRIDVLNVGENDQLKYPPLEVAIRGNSAITDWFEMIIKNARDIIDASIRSKSTRLDIGSLGITDLTFIPELFNHKHLKELVLSNEWAEYKIEEKRWDRRTSGNNVYPNKISMIPEEIKELKNLEILIAGGDWNNEDGTNSNPWEIREISNISSLNKIKNINLSNNKLSSLVGIEKFYLLEKAHLNNNEISDVPSLKPLKQLKELFLSNNKIENINFLEGCLGLTTIDLHSNLISDLVPLKNILKNTDLEIKVSSWEVGAISISKNKKDINPPYAILEQNKNDILLYFTKMEYEDVLKLPTYLNNEIKIILVGNSFSGKSTLLHWLATSRIKKNICSTVWMETKVFEREIRNKKIRLRYFDFGGQEYYHDTHNIFFTDNTVYIVVWDKESDKLGKINVLQTQHDNIKRQVDLDIFPLNYWLDSISIFGKRTPTEIESQISKLLHERSLEKTKHSKKDRQAEKEKSLIDTVIEKNIIIVQNKIEQDGVLFLNQQEFGRKFSNIFDFSAISIFEKKRLVLFKSLFEELIVKMSYFDKPLLATWGELKDSFQTIFEKKQYIITIDEFRDSCNEHLKTYLKKFGIPNKKIESILFKSKDDISSFMNYLHNVGYVIYNDKNEGLGSKIVIWPREMMTIINNLLLVAKENNGVIKKNRLSSDVSEILLFYNIIFAIPTDKESFIAPLYLPEKPSQLVDILISKQMKPYRRFIYPGFIHKNAILNIFSKFSEKIVVADQTNIDDFFYFWKKGFVIQDPESEQTVMIRFNFGEEENNAFLDIFDLNGKNKDFVVNVTNVVKETNKQYGVIEQVTLEGQYFVHYDELVSKFDLGAKFITGVKYDKETKQIICQDINIFKFNQLMPVDKKKPLKKIFISYSKKDETIVNNFIEHLSTMHSDGLIESWYCTELRAGDDWDQKIKHKMAEADIFCFMVSPHFMSTPYIHKYEVKTAMARYEKGDPVKIVSILLDFVNWDRNYTFLGQNNNEITWKLSKFTALPFAGKEIRDFENENKGWFIVENALRTIVTDELSSEVDEDDIVRKFPPKIKKIYEEIMAANK
ncbi:leucine-rich repeat domain-containing protein [Flavobacterium sp.]|uniref:leucine-rich repeat domain-containing protein n=1 Tax=Flavobacterium sp. TaxID=239 RepID=UPI0039E2A8B1